MAYNLSVTIPCPACGAGIECQGEHVKGPGLDHLMWETSHLCPANQDTPLDQVLDVDWWSAMQEVATDVFLDGERYGASDRARDAR